MEANPQVLEALDSANRTYWANGGPKNAGNGRVLAATLDNLRAEYGDDAVEVARDYRDAEYEGACEAQASRREEEPYR